MKKLILLLSICLCVKSILAQRYKIGIVKEKDVTYEIKENKRNWIIRNINNPDTTTKEIPHRYIMLSPNSSIIKQIAKIVHDHLSSEELMLLRENWDAFGLTLRIDRDKYKIRQVVNFCFTNWYTYYKNMPLDRRCEIEKHMKLPKKYEGFWLNLPLDRLHEIEKDIVDKVKLPDDLEETFLVDDFEIWLTPSDFCNPAEEKTET